MIPATLPDFLELAALVDPCGIEWREHPLGVTWALNLRTCADFDTIATRTGGKRTVVHKGTSDTFDAHTVGSIGDDQPRWHVTHFCRGTCDPPPIFPRQTCPHCLSEHPGRPCPEPSLFDEETP